MPREVALQIIYTDGGLISMQLMLVARSKGYDTVPMEDTIKRNSLKLLEFPNSMCRLCSLLLEKQRNQDIRLHVFLLRMYRSLTKCHKTSFKRKKYLYPVLSRHLKIFQINSKTDVTIRGAIISNPYLIVSKNANKF